MTDTDSTDVPNFDLDRICWILCHGLADFEHRAWLDMLEFDEGFVYNDDETADYEQGYAHGRLSHIGGTIEHLVTEGIDVFERARRYSAANDVNLAPAWLEDVDTPADEPDASDWEIHLHDRAETDDTMLVMPTSIPEERHERWEAILDEQDEDE